MAVAGAVLLPVLGVISLEGVVFDRVGQFIAVPAAEGHEYVEGERSQAFVDEHPSSVGHPLG